MQVDPKLTPRVDRAWPQLLKLECDELLSSSALNFNLCRYTSAGIELETQLYVLRRLATVRVKEARELPVREGLDDFYICSLSSRTMVYKGQLKPEQAGGVLKTSTRPTSQHLLPRPPA